MLNSIYWGKISVNEELSVDTFSPTEIKRTAFQSFLEQLYYQRTDTAALKCTYSNFKKQNSDLNISKGVQFIGYQILKRGEATSAICLLKLNLKDYPAEAAGNYSLARVFATIKKNNMAKPYVKEELRLYPTHKRSIQLLKELEPGTKIR